VVYPHAPHRRPSAATAINRRALGGPDWFERLPVFVGGTSDARSRIRPGARHRAVVRPDLVELHAIAQLVALETQRLRGATLVPLGSIRGAQNQGALDVLDELLERNPARRHRAAQELVHTLAKRALCGRARPRMELEVVRLEHLAVLEQHGALEQ